STMYMGAIWQSKTQTLQAIAVKAGYGNSPVTTAAYTIAPVLPTPTFSLAGGTAAYPSPQAVTISDSTAGASIYYTTNGTTPTASSTKYTGAITVSVTETIQAIAIENGYTNSTVASVLYTIASNTSSNSISGFSISAASTIATVTPGGSVAYDFNVSPLAPATIFPEAINLSASGLPPGATYSITPVKVPKGAGATTITLTVQVQQAVAHLEPPGGIGGNSASRMPLLALASLLLPFARGLRRAGKRVKGCSIPTLFLLTVIMITLIGVEGCGSTNQITGPMPQSYKLIVMGTTGEVSQSVAVTLTVMQ
ncbi:MAG: chitobiase/beta-hexosaminidase C-terminal domain-containing protein, partial [Terracidiphilus sp.]